jgi:hypothetical protein
MLLLYFGQIKELVKLYEYTKISNLGGWFFDACGVHKRKKVLTWHRAFTILRVRESCLFHVLQFKFKFLTLILNCLLFRVTYMCCISVVRTKNMTKNCRQHRRSPLVLRARQICSYSKCKIDYFLYRFLGFRL